MYNESQGADLQTIPEGEDQNINTINCPRCQSIVPETLYCLRCGYPLTITESSEEDKSHSLDSEQFDVESLRDMQVDPIDPNNDVNEPEQVFDDKEMITPEIRDTSQDDNQLLPETSFQIESEPKEVDDTELVDDDTELKDIMLIKEHEDIFKNYSDVEITLPTELSEDDIGIKTLDYVNPSIIELATDMMNSVFLELWSINLLVEGDIQGEHFTKVFETYKGRFDECVSRRDYMLNKVQDIESNEKKIKEATVELAELDIRKTLNDLNEGEYDSLSPALKWTIQHFEKDVENRKGTIDLLNNLTSLMPDYRILEMKVKAENTKRTLNDMDISQIIGVRTAEKVKSSLDDILFYLGEED